MFERLVNVSEFLLDELIKQKKYCTRMPANNVLNANASKPSNLKYTDNENDEKLIHRAFKVRHKKRFRRDTLL